jgi:calpain family cysteine protease
MRGRYETSDQGVDGDCYFLSAMTAITTKSPDKIVDMFIDNGDDTWTVQFFNKNKPCFVTIDKMLPVDGQDEFVFTGDTERYDNPQNVLWAALVEKAYCQFAEFGYLDTDGPKTNSYAALDEGFPNLAMGNILSTKVPAMAKIGPKTSNAMATAFGNDRPVVLVTVETPPSAQIVSDHVYAMLGYNATTQKFELFNPWGIVNNNTGKPGLLHLTFAEISQNFGYWGRGTVI